MKAITLTRGLVARVDDEDYERFGRLHWCASRAGGTWYAERKVRKPDGRSTTTRLHREVMGNPPGMLVDHIDGDGLNNVRSNLRVATPAQNGQNRGAPSNNTSGFKGVYYSKRYSRWRAEIWANGRKHYVGSFDTRDQACAAHAVACARLHGEFAKVG